MQYTIESDDDIPLDIEDETDTEAFESDVNVSSIYNIWSLLSLNYLMQPLFILQNLSGDKKSKRKSNFKKDHDKKSQFIRFEIDDGLKIYKSIIIINFTNLCYFH